MKLQIGNEKMSILKQPFKVDKVDCITVEFRPNSGYMRLAYGFVRFKNGDTTGKQEFEGDTFDEVVVKIRTFLETLN